jgi:hypothetical protein
MAERTKRQRRMGLSQMIKVASKEGLQISSIEQSPDGGFRLNTERLDSGCGARNEWDIVLQDRPHG